MLGVLHADRTNWSSEREELDEVDDMSDELESVRRGVPGLRPAVERHEVLNDLPKLAIVFVVSESLAG